MQVISAKADGLMGDTPPSRVILEADPIMLGPRREGKNLSETAERFRKKEAPILWQFEESHRQNLYTYWKMFMTGEEFVNQYTLHTDGAMTLPSRWDQVDKEKRSELTKARVDKNRPSPVPASTKSARAYEDTVQALVSHGAEICLVSMPMTPLFISLISDLEGYQESLDFFEAVAERHSSTYLDLRDAVTDLSLFVNQDHLNERGALLLAAQLVEGCFGPRAMVSTSADG